MVATDYQPAISSRIRIGTTYWIRSKSLDLSRSPQILLCRFNGVQALTQATHVGLLCRSKTMQLSLGALRKKNNATFSKKSAHNQCSYKQTSE